MNSDLINRSDAIEAFADMREGYPVVHGDMLSDADVVAILQDLPSAQPEQQWILCSERLPEEGMEVLVTDIWQSVHIYSMEFSWKGTCYWEDTEGYLVYFEDVIAWMPLPDAFRGFAEE